MYKVKIENKTIDVDNNISVEELINDNLENPSCVAAKLNDKLVDLSCIVREDSNIEIETIEIEKRNNG